MVARRNQKIRKDGERMLKELCNGNYFIYQIDDGGCGIVKADDVVDAIVRVIVSYREHGERDLSSDDVKCYNIKDISLYFSSSPDVLEFGWSIEVIY